MNDIIKKKLNLLVHLAKIDGKFDDTERQVLYDMLKEYGIAGYDSISEQTIELNDFSKELGKEEVMFWALRMILADGVVHPDEEAYCKALAIKLGFKLEIVDYFINLKIFSLKEFVKQSGDYYN